MAHGHDNILIIVASGTSAGEIITGTSSADVDTFVLRAGQSNGDTIIDCAGQCAVLGDNCSLVTAQGATFVHIGTTHWRFNSADGSMHDVITLSNGASVHATDYLFQPGPP